MNTHADDARLAEYVRRLRWGLSALPDAERDGIVAETRSHVLDRVDAGATLDEALAALGAPEEYAKAFCESYTVTTALSSRRIPELIGAVLRNAARSAAVAAAGVAIFIAWAIAAISVYLTVLKVSDPAHVGLWRGDRFFFLGIIDDPSAGQELLGPWLPAVALLLVVVAWAVTQVLSVWALKRLAPRH